MRLCPEPRCPNESARKSGGPCAKHLKERETARGSRQERGYDARHEAERAKWKPVVEAGQAICAKCRKPIAADADWHMGHSDDRRFWTGPEHAFCNLSAAGRASHRGR